jgi:hypothetical protein
VTTTLERDVVTDPRPVGDDVSETAGTAAADLHHVVIVGGGAGGLVLATRLGRKLARQGRPASRSSTRT